MATRLGRCSTMWHHAVPYGIMQHLVAWCSTMGHQAVPCGIMPYHVASCRTIKRDAGEGGDYILNTLAEGDQIWGYCLWRSTPRYAFSIHKELTNEMASFGDKIVLRIDPCWFIPSLCLNSPSLNNSLALGVSASLPADKLSSCWPPVTTDSFHDFTVKLMEYRLNSFTCQRKHVNWRHGKRLKTCETGVYNPGCTKCPGLRKSGLKQRGILSKVHYSLYP